MEILSSALILMACASVGISGIYITRNRSGINKHSRQHIKDIQQDMKYLSDMKKEEALEYRKQIQSLKGTVNKMKQGTTITDNDMKNSSLGEVILQIIPNKYRKAASFLVPQIEEAVKKDPTLIEKVYERIKSTNNQQAKTPDQDQTTNTL
jgi:predicted ATPase